MKIISYYYFLKIFHIQINEQTKNKDDNEISDKEGDNKNHNEYLTSYVNNKYSNYPELKGTKFGETKLEDIKNFLISELNNSKKKKWPKYIEEAIEHNINIKKNNTHVKPANTEVLKNRKNKGRSDKQVNYGHNEIINIKNMKCQFKKSVKHYKLSEDNNLLYEDKTKIFNKLDNTYKIKKELYEVPTVEILNNNLYEIHIM